MIQSYFWIIVNEIFLRKYDYNHFQFSHSVVSNSQPSEPQLLSPVRLCNPMNCSIPGFPVHHQLLEFTQTHVHWVGNAIQPSHPLSSPSPPILNLSQHQGLFQWVCSLHQVAKVLRFSFNISPSSEHPGLYRGLIFKYALAAKVGILWLCMVRPEANGSRS